MSAHHLGMAAGPSVWAFGMICQSSDTTLDVTLELVHLILSGDFPWIAFLLEGVLIGLEKRGGSVQPIANKTRYHCAGICALRMYGRGIGACLVPLRAGVGTPGGTKTVRKH